MSREHRAYLRSLALVAAGAAVQHEGSSSHEEDAAIACGVCDGLRARNLEGSPDCFVIMSKASLETRIRGIIGS